MKRKPSQNQLIDAYNAQASDHQRSTADLLPSYIQTDKNKKFLSATLDKLIEVPQVERIDGFVGSKITPTYNPETDYYLDSTTELAKDYQLEPAMVIKDEKQDIVRAVTYDDFLKQLEHSGAEISNHNRILQPKTFTYNPHIDLDKFVNYNQYYWLESGPDPIQIAGPQKSTVSTYSVTDNTDGTNTWLLSPDGLTPNPMLTLYRGMTYVFNVTSKHSFYIKTAISYGKEDQYEKVVNNGKMEGQVILTVDDTTPPVLYYVAGDDSRVVGRINVRKLIENSELDVEKDILGKKTYRSGNNVEFTNGMMVYFIDNVTPEAYRNRRFLVQGVGRKIVLVDFDTLQNNVTAANNLDTDFDVEPFDKFPFDDFTNAPITPEYITIDRASEDLNPWTRYNRWFHKDVITATAAANGVDPVYPVDKRAQRPIIEFEPNIKLYNFGTKAMKSVDLIDNTTLDAFSKVEKSAGYYIDGILVEEGYRVIFNADTDPLVRGRIYTVTFDTIGDDQRINLVEDLDGEPFDGASMVVTKGNEYRGATWYWDVAKNTWVLAQQKTTFNQAPVFDLFDENGISFSNINYYQGSFVGTKLFGYTEGTVYDSILGLNLKFLNVANIGDFLFTNYFNTDTFIITNSGTNISYPVSSGFLKITSNDGYKFANVWEETVQVDIPILQYNLILETSNNVAITSIDYPGWTTDLTIDVWKNNKKLTNLIDFNIITDGEATYVVFKTSLVPHDKILCKIYTARPANKEGYYEPSLALTNNPLNGPIGQVTLAEMSDHYKTICERWPDFTGEINGENNFRDAGEICHYGTRLISHQHPLSFAQFFLGQKEYNLIPAIRKVAYDYFYYKNSFILKTASIPSETPVASAVDQILTELNAGKDIQFPYGYSDMLTYGKDYVTYGVDSGLGYRHYVVADTRITSYSIASPFNTSVLSERAILVYLNNVLLLLGTDYTFDLYDSNITFTKSLALGDEIVIKDYSTTEGCYVPPTPTKLGLYSKFTPQIYVDDTYVTPTKVIQGHDGSTIIAFNDYRDDIILEFEKRIYNNIKTVYNPELVDIHDSLPGAYRAKTFSYNELMNILVPDFLKWAGNGGVDYITNVPNVSIQRTYNYRTSSIDKNTNLTFPGHWRGMYKYFYDTDRPHTCPWEMLGFSEKPSWWESEYGTAPYTSGNKILWTDLRDGTIKQGTRAGIDTNYARPNLFSILPVDEYGNLLDPLKTGLAELVSNNLIDESWKFGDHSPAETAWRRSSLWPFAAQILLALTKPSAYASLMFDPSRIKKSAAGQYSYGDNEELLKLDNVILYRDVVDGQRQLGSGYSVILIEAGLQRTNKFLTEMKADIANISYQLMYKTEGFVNKDKLRVIIDSVDPTSTNPGVLLPAEDYEIILTKSSPLYSFNISGIIVQKDNASYIVKGYDTYRPFFKINKPVHTLQDKELRIGGKSEPYVTWTEEKFYQTGQVVFNNSVFYRTKQSHTSTNSFDLTKFQPLASLPIIGGLTLARAITFESTETIISYGTKFTSVQEVVDFILGYGKYLENQGFIFEELQDDFGEILNWEFSAKEFMFWTTQNWANGAIITLSPFAHKLKFSNTAGTGDAIYGVVDDVTNNFYEYSLLTADGSLLSHEMQTCSRLDDGFEIQTLLPSVGLYFAQINIIQKQHAIVFDNYSMFNDIIYDTESGYRQRRAKLSGFRTSEWTGGLSSPGFVFDEAKTTDWQAYKDYYPGDIVRYNGKYYSPKSTEIYGSSTFIFANWDQLSNKPAPELISNFEYKIGQFEDFYSLDIDNFDIAQQRMAQHLTGYSPRGFLDNIFNDPIARYKFYQGYIREKGTVNSINKIAKATVNQLKGEASINEAWAFRVGHFGGYNSYQELEIKLDDNEFVQNPQVIQFTDYAKNLNNFIYYKPVDDVLVKPEDYDYNNVFPTTDVVFDDFIPELPIAGYVRIDDVTATAYNKNSLLDIGDIDSVKEGTTFWLGFREDGDWDVLRYTRMPIRIIDFNIIVPGNTGQFLTSAPHGLQPGDIIGVSRFKTEVNKVYAVLKCPSANSFIVATTLTTAPTEPAPYVTWSQETFYDVGDYVYYQGDYYKCTSAHTSSQDFAVARFIRLDSAPGAQINIGQLFKFISVRFQSFDDVRGLERFAIVNFGDKVWIDNDGEGKFAVYEKINNYQPLTITSGDDNPGQLYGFNVSIESTTSTFVVSAPTYDDINYGNGLITVYERSNSRATNAVPLLSYRLNDVGNTDYYTSPIPSNFGFSLKYDKAEDLIFAGAPNASHIRPGVLASGIRYSESTFNSILLNYVGVVKLTKIYRTTQDDLTLGVLCSPSPTAGGQFGYAIAVNTGTVNKTFLVGAPGEGTAGKVYVYNMGGSVLNANIAVPGRRYSTTSTVTLSAPNLAGGRTATAHISLVSNFTTQQLQDDPNLVNGQILSITIDNPGYGYTSAPTVTFGNTTGISAEVTFDIGVTTSSKAVFINPAQAILPSAISVKDSKFGYSIGADNDLTKVAVGAPGYLTNTGAVEVFVKVGTTYSLLQTIDKNSAGLQGVINYGDNFGSKVVMTRDGSYIFISAPGNQTSGYQGFVSVWLWNGTNYSWLQNIINPNKNANTVFGTDICIDEDNQNLIISGLGDLYSKSNTFDVYSEKLYPDTTVDSRVYTNDPASDERKVKTTFDSNSTKFISAIHNAGQVSIFNRYNTYFSYAQDLDSILITENSNFGLSVTQSNDNIYVGAPTSTTAQGENNGEILVFVKQDTAVNSWSLIRKQDSLIDINALKKAFTVNVEEDKIQDYLSIIDPMKGKIPGAADQELTYKTLFDPAVYSLGNTGVIVDTNTNWIDDNVGQLWWDLSAVKFLWYEQGELDYRKNNWGGTFPGSSINVYEWVKSEYLPSEWAAIADTNEGLIKGISGQPKYPDNSVLSIKQVYNSLTQSFSNIYYYWVKNKVTIPTNVFERRLSALAVAGLIADPKGQNVKAINVLNKNSVSLVNIKDSIQSSEVNLHLNIDTVSDSAPRHTEWLLLQEDDEFSVPPVMLERKLFNSLAGFDEVGNTVPDPKLSVNQRYGISIRPLQGMFVNRFDALRNLIVWTNSILLEQRVTKLCKFENLNAFDQIPDETLNEYDVIVEDNYTLSTIVTRGLQQATLACTITKDGRLDSVVVVSPGNGYNPLHPPTVHINGTGENAIIKTVVNDIGKVTSAYIESQGTGFTSVPKLTVRPYTAIVRADSTAGGFWTKFAWDQSIKEWVRVETQKYDTRLLWKYVDWQDSSYNALQDFVTTVSAPYELDTLNNINAGDYVKVKNSGDGNFMVVRKTVTSTIGSWDKNWDVIYEQNGTIQIVDKLWNETLTDYAFDEVAAYDQTLFDQSINKEIIYLLRAIKDELFVGILKKYWNKFFFKAVKYAVQEQHSLEWAFKTSYINVINNAGTLDQRPTYKLQDSSYYEDWINEVKPYHTKIRNFTVKYDYVEDTNTFVSDFDLPPYFDSVNDKFITLSQSSAQMIQYPYRAWFDNYTNFVNDIVVIDSGSDYITPPKVKIIPAPGDLGTGATAEAYISLGKVYEIIVTNKGTGYTVTPAVLLEGGLGLTGVQARAAVHLGNSKVRANNMRMKFDRISYNAEVNDISATDQFTGDGSTYEFVLTWVPQPDRNTIRLTQAGTMILNDKFTIKYYEEPFTNTNGMTYNKKYAKLVLNFVPVENINLTIDYKKSIEIFNAIDRIDNYYSPLPGMPGKDPDQLMTGLSYGGVKVETLPFSYSSAWDTLKWMDGAWDSYSSEANYGTVKNPQDNYVTVLANTQAQLAEAVYQQGFWNSRVGQITADLSTTTPYIMTGINQYDTNPAYQYLLSQLAQAQGMISYWVDQANTLSYNLGNLQNGNVPVITPFVVNSGTFINVYINTGTGVNLRLDGGIGNTGTYGIQTISGQGTTATIYIPASVFGPTTNTVTFRDQNSDGTILPADPDALDAVISGGDLDAIILGIAPSDIVVDGYKFVDAVSSYAPEEMLPGQIQESVAISVFEQKSNASPVIVNRRFELGGDLTYPLGIKVASTASLFVITDKNPLRYNIDYTVNAIANTITLTSPITTATWLNVSTMSVGGNGLIDYQIGRDSNTTSTVFVSNTALKNIKDAYVVINGTEWTDFVIEAAPGRAKNKTPKGAVRVNHNAIGTKEIQVWMFNQPHKAYSQVHEQLFQNIEPTQIIFPLSQPPGTVLPHHSQVIVDWNGRRLLPPQVSYYIAEAGQFEFDVDANDPLIAGQANIVNTEVYRNGEKLTPGTDYQLTPPPTRVLFSSEKIATGDAIAIAVLYGHEYKIEGNNLVLSTITRTTADKMRVVTFTNHDGSKIRKERFAANRAGKYAMSRPILNSNYVWVEYNGKPLINELDYRIEDDLVTVRLRDDFYKAASDKVVIMSLSDSAYTGATSYRMFTDILGRTSYKRLSSTYSTKLAQPLVATDTKIYVENASVLTPPNPEKNLPGVAYIAGERIEFFSVVNNELSQLRRGTLGTGILDGLPTGTLVIDQGKGQNLPVTDTTQIERFTSTVTTNVYTLTSITVTGTATKTWVDPTSGNAQILGAPPLTDMFEVMYGGVPLLKPTTNLIVKTDTAIAYDSGQNDTFGNSSTSTVSAQFTMSSVIINSNEYPVLHFGFDVQPGIEVFVSKRTGKIFENTDVFTFLQETPGILPEENYYPGDPIIILETGAVLTDELENPLEGI